MFAPMIDGLWRILRRLDVGLLVRQSEIVEYFPYIGVRIIDAPFFPNEVGNDPRGPAVGQVAGGPRSGQEDGFEFLKLFRRQFGGTTGTGFSCEGLKAVGFDFLSPSFDGGKGNIEDIDDFVVVESAQDQLPALETGGRLTRQTSMLCAHAIRYA